MARKNTTEAVKAWMSGKTYRAPGRNGSPIWTADGVLYSYNKEIARFASATDRRAILNMDKYSVTTSCQQNGVYNLMIRSGIDSVVCECEDTYRRHCADF